MDVGIVPLEDTDFNAAKSRLKGLEMAAVGVPFVASPRDEYQRLHRLGAGLLADRPRDWRRHLTRLVRDGDYREELADRGRAVAAAETYENHADRWWAAWQRAADNRTKSKGRAA
jgi:hypothetical protein